MSRRRQFFGMATLGVILATGCHASDPVAEATLPSGTDLLAGVWERFPQEPVTIIGELMVRGERARGARLSFQLEADWGAHPVRAIYTIRDETNGITERVTVTREGGKAAEYRFERGDPPQPEPLPDLGLSIGVTDISWLDLTLAFLWWPNPEVVGTETVRGRSCYVVSVRPPASMEGGPYTRVTLWIDREVGMLLQAEGYDSAGERVRRLWIQSLKKLSNRWMIKDLEVQAYPAQRRTRLLVKSLKVSGKETLDGLTSGGAGE